MRVKILNNIFELISIFGSGLPTLGRGQECQFLSILKKQGFVGLKS